MKMKLLLITLCFAICTAPAWAGHEVNTEDNRKGTVTIEDWNADVMTKAELKTQKKQDRQLLRTEKNQYKMEKRMAWFSKLISKKMAKTTNKRAIGGLDDPVDKWFWYWIIGWGAGIVLFIIAAAVATGGAFSGGFGFAAVLALLGWLVALGGTVALIIWLVNKFG